MNLNLVNNLQSYAQKFEIYHTPRLMFCCHYLNGSSLENVKTLKRSNKWRDAIYVLLIFTGPSIMKSFNSDENGTSNKRHNGCAMDVQLYTYTRDIKTDTQRYREDDLFVIKFSLVQFIQRFYFSVDAFVTYCFFFIFGSIAYQSDGKYIIWTVPAISVNQFNDLKTSWGVVASIRHKRVHPWQIYNDWSVCCQDANLK